MHNKFSFNVYNMITGLSQVHCCHCCELQHAACCLLLFFFHFRASARFTFRLQLFHCALSLALFTKGNFSATMSVDFHFTMQQHKGCCCSSCSCCTSPGSCCCCRCRWLCALSVPLLSVMLPLLLQQHLIQCKCVKACRAYRKTHTHTEQAHRF